MWQGAAFRACCSGCGFPVAGASDGVLFMVLPVMVCTVNGTWRKLYFFFCILVRAGSAFLVKFN